MKSLEEIKDEYAKSVEFSNWQELLTYWGEQNPNIIDSISTDLAKEYALEVAIESLKNANSKLRDKDFLFHDDYELAENLILSESNIPKL